MINILKEWKKLIVIEGVPCKLSILTNIVILICGITEPIALSSFIGNASVHNSTLALIWLGINLGLIIMEHIAWHINYTNYTKLISPTYINLQNKLTSAVLKAEEPPLDSTKLNYCINSDIFGIATFIDTLILRIASIIKFLILLVIIFVYSYVVGVMLVVMSAVGYSLLIMYNRLKQKSTSIMQSNEMASARKTDEIINMADVINKYNLNSPVLLEQERRLKGYVNSYNTLYSKRSLKDNFILIYWYTMLSIVFMVCYFEFNNLVLSLSVFLVLIDYSTSFVKLTENAFDFTIEITELEEKVKRVNDYLCLSKKADTRTPPCNNDGTVTNGEQRVTGEQYKNDSKAIFLLTYTKVGTQNGKNKFTQEFTIGKIYIFQDVFFSDLFYENKSPKIKIMADDELYENIYQLPNLLEVTDKNEMFNDNCLQNLQIIKNDTDLIFDITKTLGLDEILNKLSQEEQQFANRISSESTIILLNIVRALLSDAQIVCIKIDDRIKDFTKKLSTTLKTFGVNKCILLYDPLKLFGDKAGNIVG